MSPRFSARQNKIRLITGFLAIVILALTFQVLKFRSADAAASAAGKAPDAAMFMGLRHASPKEIQSVLPATAGKPTMLAFSSRLCHDCQRMNPALSRLSSQHRKVYYRKVDVLEARAKSPAILRVFKPVSVPTLVFIKPDGRIVNVLYNYQSPEAINTALVDLQQP